MLTAVLIGFGVNLAASTIPSILDISDIVSLFVGALIIAAGIAYFIVIIARSRTGTTLVRAAVLYDPKQNV